MRLRTKILLASILCALLAQSRAAWALTVLDPFWGDVPVSAYIGITGGLQFVAWQRKSDGACAFSLIGNADSLFDNYVIHGSSGDDHLEVVLSGVIIPNTPPMGRQVCGITLFNLVYGGHYLDLDGRGGNDTLVSSDGDTWLWGGSGNDYLFFSNPGGQLHGGDDNDRLIANSAFGSGEALFGEAGSDCLEDANASAVQFDCGANGAFGLGDLSATGRTPANAVGCELRTSSCQ